MFIRLIESFSAVSLCAFFIASTPMAPALAQDDAAAAGPTVLVQTVETQSIRPSFTHPARIEALNTASIRPPIQAQITAMHITAGSYVEEGDLLVEMDETDFRIALAQAHAALKQAEASAIKADLDLDRATQLSRSNTVSQREVEYAQAQADVAQAQVDVASAQIAQAEENLADTKVYAPFSGRISAPQFAVGDLFAPGDPTQPGFIATLVSLDPIYAVGLVDQSNYFGFLAKRLEIEEAGGSIPPLELEAILPGGQVYPEKGTFENWDNTGAASTGTIAARVLFANPDGLLLPGQNVTIRGQVIEPIQAPLVPQRAVSLDQQGHFVWVVGADNTVERRNITVGVRSDANWTITEGLEDGEQVVVEGLQSMRPGITVSPKPYDS
ncbi:efflux RND transporter periplasmic adaptor subunit [Alloyangia pacifica]|uniref:Membrane fusion protein, multidrug efflux system n=1 Tax=Alloyangia pacifica TaxID=311180 RepID=A0A1I6W9C5_9RHOB|nr:efflux RND transporter periplasmic adaptor subunit [Alloyangia pacifica]SDI44924.1 membrane fusion protein, multidrug efflux system [Alloyangia pacifica]SFT22361.1 membrane fusion protein, multidrug efflux system [Alloyangia pacifica]